MWKYSWSRSGKPIPENSEITDFNRVLTIRNARLEDQGVYTCHVKRGSVGDSKSYTLQLEGKKNTYMILLFFITLSTTVSQFVECWLHLWKVLGLNHTGSYQDLKIGILPSCTCH